MDKIKCKGGSVEEALEGAAEILRVEKDQIEYNILEEGKTGMLGIIGAKETEIEAWKKMLPQEEAAEIMQEILNKMKLLAVADAKTGEQGEILVEIKGEDIGQIIGKDGATLAALQTILSTALSNRHGSRIRVFVDAGGYKARQAQAIERVAIGAAKDVETTGKEKILPPMSAAERRIVHVALKENPRVTTHSEGEGSQRHLIITPK